MSKRIGIDMIRFIAKSLASLYESKGFLRKGILYCIKYIVKIFPKTFVETVISNVDLGRYVTISFDCDLPDDVKAYENVIEILKKHNVNASFAVVGKLIETHPEEHEILIDEGHEILNHTYTHPHSQFNPKRFIELKKSELYEEIVRFDDVCLRLLEYKPVGYRAPHFVQRPDVYEILRDRGYIYSTSTIASMSKGLGKPYVIDDIIEIPLTPNPKQPFTTLTTWGIWRAPKRWYDEEEFYSLLNFVVEIGAKHNAYLNFYFDPCDVIVMNGFEDILKTIKKRGYKFLRYRDLVEVITSEGSGNRARWSNV